MGTASIIAFGLYFFGLTGHDPWKADEAYIFGVIHSMLEDGSWLVPLIAGEPFMEKPPLYAWLGASLVRLSGNWASEADAARLASGVFMSIAIWSVAAAAHEWWGKGSGRYAPIILCSCIGLLVQSHMMMPDVPLVTGVSLALWGLSLILHNPVPGGILLGIGVGVSFLSKGLLGPGVIGISSALLPLLFAQWRVRNYLSGLVIAFFISLPFLTIWPALLYVRSPDLFMSWIWDNNVGRFFGFSAVANGTEVPPLFWWKTLPWFAFPALPLALRVLYVKRKLFAAHVGMQCATIMSLVILLAISSSASARAVYAFPLLVPLAILAVPAVFTVGKTIDQLWFYVNGIIFVPLAAGVWIVWIIMMQTSATPRWAWLHELLPADFVPRFDSLQFVIAAVLTVFASLAVVKSTRVPGRGLLSWMIGMTLVWVLLSTLSMPWLNYGKSYRTVFENISWPMARCVASKGLGESERAMLDYYADRLTLRHEISSGRECDVLFIQGYSAVGIKNIDSATWQLIWSGARPGDSWQKFWLYKARS